MCLVGPSMERICQSLMCPHINHSKNLRIMGGLWNYLRREVESIREVHPLVSDVQDLGSFVLRFSTWNKHATQHLLPM